MKSSVASNTTISILLGLIEYYDKYYLNQFFNSIRTYDIIFFNTTLNLKYNKKMVLKYIFEYLLIF